MYLLYVSYILYLFIEHILYHFISKNIHEDDMIIFIFIFHLIFIFIFIFIIFKYIRKIFKNKLIIK